MDRKGLGRIILIRHGETEANRLRCFADSDDIPLTETGRSQSHALALRLSREFRAQVLICSPFRRAQETGEIIGRVLGLTVETLRGIQERDFGCLRGQPYEHLGARKSSAGHDPSWSPEGGESLNDVRRRAIEAIESLRNRYPDQEIVVVCHGAVIQAICAHIAGEWIEGSVPSNCGFVTIGYEEQGWMQPVLSGDWDEILPPA
ncbi:MAG TPA: histidine phosphatase family protein [Bryobacteraceae bacterium]|jgi:broad specificity phosphatase PhoE|nr:histidine phosphatase family protein [Bryobacteraceae bacterium]